MIFQEDVGTKQVNLHLFRLFHQERESRECEEELQKKNVQLAEVNRRKDKIEAELKEKKKDVGKAQRELAKVEQTHRDADVELNKRKPAYIKAKEKTAHMQKKLDAAKKSLEAATKTHKYVLINLNQLHVFLLLFSDVHAHINILLAYSQNM